MERLELTLPTAVENVALDEALLLEADAGDKSSELLRLWEAAAPLVVIGRSTPMSDVNTAACHERGIPMLRRASGGAAIVSGPGCLMYAVVLSYARHPRLRDIDHAHGWVLDTITESLRRHLPAIARQGISDLTLDEKKFSGNSLRCKRDHFLYHGTLLYDFKLELIEQCLHMPARQPDYRGGRSHAEFVANLPLDAATLRAAIVEAFGATDVKHEWPRQRVAQLVADKYGRADWNAHAGRERE